MLACYGMTCIHYDAECELDAVIHEKARINRDVAEQQDKLSDISKQYDRLKTLLEQKPQSRTRRENTSTTFATIKNNNSGTRYRRREETQNVLEYIHGGEEGALYGAWDFVAANATKHVMETLIGSYR